MKKTLKNTRDKRKTVSKKIAKIDEKANKVVSVTKKKKATETKAKK